MPPEKDRGNFASPNLSIVKMQDFADVAARYCFGSTTALSRHCEAISATGRVSGLSSQIGGGIADLTRGPGTGLY
jgi:hypothetical protein